MLHTAAEITESDSACNYSWRTLDAGREAINPAPGPGRSDMSKLPTVLLRATALGKNAPRNHTKEVIDAIINVIRFS